MTEIDWSLVAKVSGGGFGLTILVLTILSVMLWLLGFVASESDPEDKETK
jgi:hypothetical protein